MSELVRESIEHNAVTKHRANVEQKVMVLDYIRDTRCTISEAVRHFIHIKSPFKLSASSVSDWLRKESEIRSSIKHNINKYKLPHVVLMMETVVNQKLLNKLPVNDAVLIDVWKDALASYKDMYRLTDQFISKGPSKGFIYRFKKRNMVKSSPIPEQSLEPHIKAISKFLELNKYHVSQALFNRFTNGFKFEQLKRSLENFDTD